jgi:hypothetical protein
MPADESQIAQGMVDFRNEGRRHAAGRSYSHTAPSLYWHVCHHCFGVGCEVCEERGGWYETALQRDERLDEWTRNSREYADAMEDARSD